MSELDREIVLLVERYLEGELDGRGRERLLTVLRAHPEAERFLREQIDMATLLTESYQARDLVAEAVERIRDSVGTEDLAAFARMVEDARLKRRAPVGRALVQERRRPGAGPLTHRRGPRWSAWISMAACLAIVVGTVVYNHVQSGRVADVLIARIKATAPGVKVLRDGDTVIAVLDMPLYAGDRITTAGGQRATFVYEGETTEIEVQEDAILDIGGPGKGKELRLERGVLDAAVDPQPEDGPMVVTTPQAVAEVKGTIFRIEVGPVEALRHAVPASEANRAEDPADMPSESIAGTRLEVFEGMVVLTRIADSARIAVFSGYFAMAAEGEAVVARAFPGTVIFEDDFENGLDSWVSRIALVKGDLPKPRPDEASRRISTERRRLTNPALGIDRESTCVVLDSLGLPHFLNLDLRTTTPRDAFAIDIDVLELERADHSFLSPPCIGFLRDGTTEFHEAYRRLATGDREPDMRAIVRLTYEYRPLTAGRRQMIECRQYKDGQPWTTQRGTFENRDIALAVRNLKLAFDRVVIRSLKNEKGRAGKDAR